MHIFTGYDHIAFLVGLLLVAAVTFRKDWAPAQAGAPAQRTEWAPAAGRPAQRTRWAARGLREGVPYVVKVVSAFTVGHTITLILAAIDVISLSSRVVESAIAASILYVAVENIALRDPRHRWPLALLFGLVHGMGFASVLRPHLPKDNFLVPLLLLNLGVELGQLSIVLVLLPLLLIAARTGASGYRRVAVVGGSGVLGAFAALWLIERVLELKLFGGRLG